MRTLETLLCSCEEGSLEIEVLAFGNWRVEKVVTPCPTCASSDIEKARAALQQKQNPS
jgi:hypothetical protein